MKFERERKTKYQKVPITEYFDGKCSLCDEKKLKLRSSRVRHMQALGTPSQKTIVELEVVTYDCLACGGQFTPENPDFPPKYEYSLDVIEYALLRYHYQNASGLQIQTDLRLLHNIDVPEATIYTWLKELSPEFVKDRLRKRPDDTFATIKTITVDGSYVNLGRDIIGKKKAVESFSVTKLDDGRFLLMWWE